MNQNNISPKNVIQIKGPFSGAIMDTYDVINVDTTLGPVTLFLQNIQSGNLLYASRCVYINDVTNTFGTNNLTIVGSLGNLVNNNPSIVITSDGANLKCNVASQNEWTVSGLLVTPPVTGDKNFVFHQVAPSTTWNVSHNLNKRCSVQVVDDLFNEILAKVFWSDNNEVIITLNKPTTGWVYCN
jgi:hypothetical protein